LNSTELVPDRRQLIQQSERDTQGIDAKVVSYDPDSRVATVVCHHRIVYDKTSAVEYRHDGHEWIKEEDGASDQQVDDRRCTAPIARDVRLRDEHEWLHLL